MLNNNNHLYSMEHSKYHRSSPAIAIANGFHSQSNNHNYHHRQISPAMPPPIHCSAYFISRVDLNNYTIQTLRQTIDNIVSGPKSKGLKVKLSLPNEGLIIHNTPDPNQSWIYRKSELLYFWRDSYYPNLIIVITLNHQVIAPYSASIFRLRGRESVQLFLQQAQRFFAELSSRNSSKTSFEKSATMDNHRKHHHHHHRKKSTTTKSPVHSLQLTTTDTIFQLYNPRTSSETTLSSDTRISNSRQLNDEEKMTTVSNYLSSDYVAELVRELKDLRSEIAALKLEKRFTPVYSTSTSPLVINSEQRMSISPLEIDAETQTDLNSIDKETTMDEVLSGSNKRKNEQININVNKRTNNGERQPSSPMDTDLSSGGVVSFRSSLEDTIASPPENIYENLPIFIPIDSNQNITSKEIDGTKNKIYLNLPISDKSQLDFKQQQYLSQLMGSQSPISLLMPSSSLENKLSTPEILPHHQQYFQQTLFSNHLTNPMFNADKQLLANTIANQFGIDQNSPDLQKLIANQHLFVANKRTFANMIWPITPEEESALCSSPSSTNLIDIYSLDSNNSPTKPILKPKKSSSLTSKGRRITWNNTFDY